MSHEQTWAESHDPDEMLSLLATAPTPVRIDAKALAFVLCYMARRLEHIASPPSIGVGITEDASKVFIEINGMPFAVIPAARAFAEWCRVMLRERAEQHCRKVFTDETSLQFFAARHALMTWVDCDLNAEMAHMLREELGNPFAPPPAPAPEALKLTSSPP